MTRVIGEICLKIKMVAKVTKLKEDSILFDSSGKAFRVIFFYPFSIVNILQKTTVCI